MSRTTIVVALLLGLAASTLSVPAGASSPSRAAAPASGSVTGETTKVTGTFGRKDARRPIELQVYRASGWSTLVKGRTSAKGTYSFSLKVPAYASMYRVLAPRTTRGGTTLPERVSATRVVTPVAQSVTVSTTTPRAGRAFTATVTARPARKGRSVKVQVFTGSRWSTVRTGAQSSRGVARLTAKAPKGSTLVRAVAAAHRGAASVTSSYDVLGAASSTVRYRVVALSSKTVEKGVETGTDRCSTLTTTVTRSSTADRPTATSPRSWAEEPEQGGGRSVNIYPDYSSTYVDELDGCRTAEGGGTVPCARTIDWSGQFPTDRMTVEVRIARGATTGQVVFNPPDASAMGYHDGWDDVCRVALMSSPVTSIPLASRSVRLPLTKLLGSTAFRVSTEGIFRDTADSGPRRTTLSSSWQQSITLQRVR